MLLFHSATHSASDKKIITRLGAPARYAAVSFNETNHANRNRHGPGCAAHFSADYADFEPLRSPAQSAIKPLHPFDLRLLGSNKSDQRKLRNGRCCGEIAKRTHHRFPADVERVRHWQKMHAFNNAIGFEHKEVSATGVFHDRAIITRAVDHSFCERKTGQKLAEQPVFSDLAQFHYPFLAPAVLCQFMEKRSPETQG